MIHIEDDEVSLAAVEPAGRQALPLHPDATVGPVFTNGDVADLRIHGLSLWRVGGPLMGGPPTFTVRGWVEAVRIPATSSGPPR